MPRLVLMKRRVRRYVRSTQTLETDHPDDGAGAHIRLCAAASRLRMPEVEPPRTATAVDFGLVKRDLLARIRWCARIDGHPGGRVKAARIDVHESVLEPFAGFVRRLARSHGVVHIPEPDSLHFA